MILKSSLIGHVPAIEYQSIDAWLVQQIGYHRLKYAPRAVQVANAPLGSHLVVRVGLKATYHCLPPAVVVRVEKVEEALTGGSRLLPPEHIGKRGTLVDDGRILAEDRDGV